MYVFENKGVMDPRSITTFGASSKENDSPIGFFGTGLKYSIAVLLRLGCSIKIVSGGRHYTFHTRKLKIRVNEFDLVLMDNQEIGFTTELGKGWDLWMAFRELACNALDERGSWYEGLPTEYKDDHTYVLVSGRAFDLVWAERDSIILQNHTPIWSDEEAEIVDQPSAWVYYRGVRIHKMDMPTRVTYNIKTSLTLTEDRTPKSVFALLSRMELALRFCTNPAIIAEILTTPDHWENEHQGYLFALSGAVFKQVALDLVRKNHPTMNKHLFATIRNAHMKEFITDVGPMLDTMDKIRLEKAIQFCKRIGYQVDKYPIIVANLADGILGCVHEDRIYIGTRCFLMGTKMVVGTLLEEFIHIEHRVRDETRGMQNLLIDTIVSLGERLTKIAL